MNVWFHSSGVVAERHAAALQIFPRTMEQFAPLPQGLHSGKWAWSAFPSVCDLGLLVCVREHCACMLKHAHTCTGLEIQVISPGKRYKCKPASCLTRLKSCLPILFQYSCCPDNFEVSYPFGSGLKCFDTWSTQNSEVQCVLQYLVLQEVNIMLNQLSKNKEWIKPVHTQNNLHKHFMYKELVTTRSVWVCRGDFIWTLKVMIPLLNIHFFFSLCAWNGPICCLNFNKITSLPNHPCTLNSTRHLQL